MRRESSHSESRSPFLEPPHRHDPASISLLATLPPCVMHQLPERVQNILRDIQESTCVAYASFQRLEDLVDERFERLMPSMGPDGTRFSESSWFNYSNQFQAEQEYLMSEALPDWHQKASLAQRALQPHFDTPIRTKTSTDPKTVGTWWTATHDCVAKWLETSHQITLPDFEDVVEDYLSGRHDAAIYETPELSPVGSLRNNHTKHPMTSAAAALHIRHELQDPVRMSKKDVEVVVKPVDVRKDSGVSMAAI